MLGRLPTLGIDQFQSIFPKDNTDQGSQGQPKGSQVATEQAFAGTLECEPHDKTQDGNGQYLADKQGFKLRHLYPY